MYLFIFYLLSFGIKSRYTPLLLYVFTSHAPVMALKHIHLKNIKGNGASASFVKHRLSVFFFFLTISCFAMVLIDERVLSGMCVCACVYVMCVAVH